MNIAQHIKCIQTAWGLSDTGLATLSGLSTHRVGEVLGGDTMSSVEFYRLADALATDPGCLAGGSSHPNETGARFRSGPDHLGNLSALDLRRIARAAQVGRVGLQLWLRQHGSKPPVTVYQQPIGVPDGHAGRAGYRLGDATRRSTHLTHDRIESLQALLEGWGVHVALVSFESPSVLGVSICAQDALPVILLNQNVPRVRRPLRRRAVLAHELAHVLHDGTPARQWHAVISRDTSQDAVETRANAFAPAFLAPWDWVDRSGSLVEIGGRLVTRWGLSAHCAAWYIVNRLKRDHAEALTLRRALQPFAAAATGFEVTPERDDDADADVSPLLDGLVSDLALRCLRAEQITAARYREIVEML